MISPLERSALTLALVAVTFLDWSTASAQSPRSYRPQINSYYAPRVVQSSPGMSREAYQAWVGAGAIGTGYGLQNFGPYGKAAGAAMQIGSPVIGYYGGNAVYNNRSQQNYYYPAPYGVQTTTPYMVRPNH